MICLRNKLNVLGLGFVSVVMLILWFGEFYTSHHSTISLNELDVLELGFVYVVLLILLFREFCICCVSLPLVYLV